MTNRPDTVTLDVPKEQSPPLPTRSPVTNPHEISVSITSVEAAPESGKESALVADFEVPHSASAKLLANMGPMPFEKSDAPPPVESEPHSPDPDEIRSRFPW